MGVGEVACQALSGNNRPDHIKPDLQLKQKLQKLGAVQNLVKGSQSNTVMFAMHDTSESLWHVVHGCHVPLPCNDEQIYICKEWLYILVGTHAGSREVQTTGTPLENSDALTTQVQPTSWKHKHIICMVKHHHQTSASYPHYHNINKPMQYKDTKW